MTLKAECDICGKDGNITDFIVPTLAHMSFTRYMDFKVRTDELTGTLSRYPDDELTLNLIVLISVEDVDATSAICKECFWKTYDFVRKQHGPAVGSPGEDSDVQSVQAEQPLQESGTNGCPSSIDGHRLCAKVAHQGFQIPHCYHCGLLRSNW